MEQPTNNFRQVDFTDIYVTDTGLVKYTDYAGNKRCDNGFANAAGYYMIKTDCARFYYVHRLVARAWVENTCPKYFNVVHHMDCNKQNNSAQNLQWTTKSLNNAWKTNQKLVKVTKGGFFQVSFVFNHMKYGKGKVYKIRENAVEVAKKMKQDLINARRNHLISCAESNQDPNVGHTCSNCGHTTNCSTI